MEFEKATDMKGLLTPKELRAAVAEYRERHGITDSQPYPEQLEEDVGDLYLSDEDANDLVVGLCDIIDCLHAKIKQYEAGKA